MHLGTYNLLDRVRARGIAEPHPFIVEVCARAAQDAAATLGATAAYWADLDADDRDYRLAKVHRMIAEPNNAAAHLHTPAPLREVQAAVVRAVLESLYEGIVVEMHGAPQGREDQCPVLGSTDGSET